MLTHLMEWAMRLIEESTLSSRTIRWIGKLIGKMVGTLPSGDSLRNLQEIRLRRTVNYAYHHSPYYKSVFARLGIGKGDIRTLEDLRKLPFTMPSDLRDWEAFICAPLDQMRAVFTTSGTTGEPKRIYYTARDLTILTNFAAVVLRWSFPGRLTALLALPGGSGLWIGTGTAQRIIEKAGGLALPLGCGDPHAIVQWMRRFEPNLVISSPSYLTNLTRAAEKEGFKIKIEQIIVGGEPLYPEQRELISAYWGTQVLNSYGATELGGAQTLAFPGSKVLAINEFHLIVEIINPQTGDPADEGDLVFTTLRREGMPLLRYRIGDRARWVPSAAGMPVKCIELLKRTDDFIILSDMGLYGQVIVDALQTLPDFSGKIAFIIDRANLVDRLKIQIEGQASLAEAARRVLIDLYPEVQDNLTHGNLILQIESGIDLSDQVKSLRINDQRQIG